MTEDVEHSPATDAVVPGARRAPRQARSLDTREKLVTAALELIRTEGYAALSTPLVARRAGVSRGALQYHFASRDDLFVAVRSRLALRLDWGSPVAELAARPLAERVAWVVDHYWSVLGSDDYVAAMEIRLYERFNGALHAQLCQEMRELAETRHREWVRLFADVSLDTDTLVGVRTYMMDALRGIALRRIEMGPEERVLPALALLKTSLVGLLAE